jgi:hypothetical protein
MIQYLCYRMYRACLRIVGAVHQTLDAGMRHGTRAHRARLNCNKEFAVAQTVVTNDCTGFAQRDDFRVGGGIVLGNVAVPSAPDDASSAHDHSADRHFAGLERALCRAQGLFHPEFIWGNAVVGRWSMVVSQDQYHRDRAVSDLYCIGWESMCSLDDVQNGSHDLRHDRIHNGRDDAPHDGVGEKNRRQND